MEHVGFAPGVIHGTLHTEAYNHTKKTQRATQTKLPSFSEKFLLVDDLLATGGTAAAAADLITALGAELIAASFFIELTEL